MNRIVCRVILLCLFSFGCTGATDREGEESQDMQTAHNHLAGEKSPYLLQHASNPVDWYPWGEVAFEKARRENKPIFLSVGYSTCHWCHVMARESFESAAVAEILNAHFVSIKVDREERPDVDRVYMSYVQATTGGGGWPMSVWLTPDLKPFFGGTYFPPTDNWGRPGFTTILARVAGAWQTDQDKVLASADSALDYLRDTAAVKPGGAVELDPAWLDEAYRLLRRSYDAEHGGFGGAPKFPRPVVPDFLLRYYARTREQAARDMVLVSLRKMAQGGMYDQLGGGFHRYSVDARWHVPHFEKMLYDQAQLVNTYLSAYQITRDPFYARIARETLDYVLRDMTGPDGQFYSAEDADSDIPSQPGRHAEGAFYAWTQTDIDERLPEATRKLFAYHYGVLPDGNVQEDPHGEFAGRNVLYVAHTVEETAGAFLLSPEKTASLLAAARQTLFEARKGRPRPHRDDKTLSAWNGLMISAFARAYQVLGDATYLEAAQHAAAFIRQHMVDEATGTLQRRHRDGETAIAGYADDYAFLIQGLIDLYEAGFDADHLAWAIALQTRMDDDFRDVEQGGYFSTTGTDESVLLRMKEDYDGAEPAANSIAVMNLLRLAQMTDRAAYAESAEQALRVFATEPQRLAQAMPAMLCALDFQLSQPKQILLAGTQSSQTTQAMLAAVHAHFLPNKILMLADGGAGQALLETHFAFLGTLKPVAGVTTAYVCQNQTCQLPVTEPDALRHQLGR